MSSGILINIQITFDKKRNEDMNDIFRYSH